MLRWAIFMVLTLFLYSSCVKKPLFPDENTISTNQYHGILILNEGLWQQNNSTLTFYNPISREVKKNVFYMVNNQILGDTANDILKIADTLFIVVSTSNTIYKLDAKTLKILQTLIIPDGGDLRKMVYVSPKKAYISALTGQKVWIINPSEMQVLSSFAISFPEEMKLVQNKLYITQSNYPPNFKNKNLVVWDILSDTKIKEIVLPVENATHLALDNTQNLWVSCTGDYINPISAVCKINTNTDSIEKNIPVSDSPTHIRTVQDTVYAMNDNGIMRYYEGITTPELWIKKEFFTEFGEVFYNFYFDETLQKWFITTSRQFIYDGRVLILSKTGNLEHSFVSGLNPSMIIQN